MRRIITGVIISLLFVGIGAAVADDTPQNAEEWHQLAYNLQNKGKFDEALEAIDHATEGLRGDDTATSIWNTKASILNNLERYDEAVSALNQTFLLDPYNAMAWRIMNSILKKQGLTEDIFDSDRVKKANLLQNTQRADDALKVINQAVEQDPDNIEAWNTRALILIKHGDREGALKSLNQTLQVDPDNVYAWHTIEYTVKNMQRFDTALVIVDQALERNPTNSVAAQIKQNIEYLSAKT